VKGMGYPKLLWLCSTNACSATPFPIICATAVLWRCVTTCIANKLGSA
jgi:hypothetical protein